MPLLSSRSITCLPCSTGDSRRSKDSEAASHPALRQGAEANPDPAIVRDSLMSATQDVGRLSTAAGSRAFVLQRTVFGMPLGRSGPSPCGLIAHGLTDRRDLAADCKARRADNPVRTSPRL